MKMLPAFALPTALMLFSCAAVPAANGPIAPPFDPKIFVSATPMVANGRRCANPVPPIVDMSNIGTFYGLEKTNSVIDRAKMGTYARRVAPIEIFKTRLRNLNARWVAIPEERPAAAACLVRQLRAWADAGALLGDLQKNDPTGHRQALLIIIWTSNVLANSYAIANESNALGADDRRAIQAWAARLTTEIRSEFASGQDRPKWLEGASNHRYWAGAALAALASITENQQDYKAMLTELRGALSAARPDGGLQRELNRGQRAIHYQSFAVEPIAVMVRSADANGVTLSSVEERQLSIIARFTATSWANPLSVQEATGKVQEKNGAMLVWIDIILPHLQRTDPALAKMLEATAAPYRPFHGAFLGVDVDAARPKSSS